MQQLSIRQLQISNTTLLQNAKLLQKDGASTYYLLNDRIIKTVVKLANEETIKSEGNIYNKEADVNVTLYESKKLQLSEIKRLTSSKSALNKSDSAMNKSGNIKAKLKVKYTWTTIKNKELLRLISATSSYKKIIQGEGVVPQKSKLYWRADGTIYTNNVAGKRGTLGKTTNYSKPTFSNVTLMPSTKKIDPVTAGVEYTLYCTRGVTIKVNIPFV